MARAILGEFECRLKGTLGSFDAPRQATSDGFPGTSFCSRVRPRVVPLYRQRRCRSLRLLSSRMPPAHSHCIQLKAMIRAVSCPPYHQLLRNAGAGTAADRRVLQGVDQVCQRPRLPTSSAGIRTVRLPGKRPHAADLRPEPLRGGRCQRDGHERRAVQHQVRLLSCAGTQAQSRLHEPCVSFFSSVPARFEAEWVHKRLTRPCDQRGVLRRAGQTGT